MQEIVSFDMQIVTVLRLIVGANVAVAVAFLLGVILFAICCGADSLREWRNSGSRRWVLP